jgi:RNA polymerase sigma-70 factor (ECF subfamily)
MSAPVDPNRKEVVERLEAIIRGMPRLTREIFIAHRLGGLSYEEIGRRTGLNVRQVERHIARAIADIDRGLHGEPRPWWRFW